MFGSVSFSTITAGIVKKKGGGPDCGIVRYGRSVVGLIDAAGVPAGAPCSRQPLTGAADE